MIVLVSSRTHTFDNESYLVDEKVYITGKTYYDITYCKPDSSMKVLVLKNQMTEIMVNYLLSDSEELVKVSGTSTAQHYRYLTMINLSKLWD